MRSSRILKGSVSLSNHHQLHNIEIHFGHCSNSWSQESGGNGRKSLFQRKNHAGRVLLQQWLFRSVCQEDRNCILYTVPDRSALTLMPIVHQLIFPGTTIMSDKWAASNQIQAVDSISIKLSIALAAL